MGADVRVVPGFPEGEFVHTGDHSRNYRIAVERPEAGRPALLHVVKRGEGEFVLHGQERGVGATRDAPPNLYSVQEDCEARLLLPVNTTHVKVQSKGDEPLSWSMRMLPLGEAAVFAGEHLGQCSDVLYRFDAVPGLFEVEVDAEDGWDWQLSFVCDHQLGGSLYVDSLCWKCREITVREAERMGTDLKDWLEGTGEDGGRFFLPTSGLITFVSEGNCQWSVRAARL
ncbi:hypothetical protein ACFC08_34235 [Streptomyces sp. NPDC056112]|uniref:hypothetical protein n=1 Tax=Streptomyces sp. NPDC056112 TaxID=3345715 RepID=UPI0035DC1B83